MPRKKTDTTVRPPVPREERTLKLLARFADAVWQGFSTPDDLLPRYPGADPVAVETEGLGRRLGVKLALSVRVKRPYRGGSDRRAKMVADAAR